MTPVHQPHQGQLDPGVLDAWMVELGEPVSGDLAVIRLGLGQSNLTYMVSDDAGRRWVLRRPPTGELAASAHDVTREARIMRALASTDVPVPRVMGLRQQDGVPWVLMEHVEGVVLDEMAVAHDMAPPARRSVGLGMPHTLAKIHAVDLGQAGLDDLASHAPYAERQLRRWSRQWDVSRTREAAEVDDLRDRLSAAVPEQAETVLVHGDFHLRNVITRDGQIVAALDWELSTLGDPLADLGTMLAYWPQSGDLASGDATSPSVLDGFPTRDELVQTYADETGRDVSAAGFWHVLGLWKLAVIAEGVLRRSLDHPEDAPSGTPSVGDIDDLVQFAHAVANHVL